VLSRHGVESEEQLKAKLARLQELEDGQKSEQEKLQAKATRAEELEQQLATYAAGQMGALTAEQQAAVKAVAGDDAGRQLSAIDALRPTWAQPAQGDGAAGQQAGQPGAQPAAKPPVAPATTTHTGATPPAGAAPPEDLAAKDERLRKTNPMEWAKHYTANGPAIEHARRQREQS
jgi:hypothetical protein